MSWHVEPIDWIDRLRHAKIIDQTGRDALCAAMNLNGYVTGGAARLLAAALLGPQHRRILGRPAGFGDGTFDTGHRHVDHLERFGWTITLSRHPNSIFSSAPGQKKDFDSRDRKWKSNISDVDVFFRDTASARACISGLNSQGEALWSAPSLAHYGVEYVYGRNLFQFITHFSGPPDEILGSFDLANAKVYFDAAGLHWSDEWARLEEDRVLGVDNWGKQNLLWRVAKWMGRHGYDNLREGDHDKYLDAVFRALDETKEGKLMRWGKPVHVDTIRLTAKKLVYRMPPREALKASIIFDSYDQINILRDVANKAMNP